MLKWYLIFKCVYGQRCHLHSISDGNGAITAQRREFPTENTGFVFLGCKITGNGNGGALLGRPWGSYSRSCLPCHTCLVLYSWKDGTFGETKTSEGTYHDLFNFTFLFLFLLTKLTFLLWYYVTVQYYYMANTSVKVRGLIEWKG